MEGAVGDPTGKMGYGILRYMPHQVVAVLDSSKSGRTLQSLTGIDHPAPIVSTLEAARELGADVLILGIAPSGGKLPESWLEQLDRSVALGFSIVNGLHDRLAPRYPSLRQDQFIWDIRVEPPNLGIATAKATKLPAKRILLVGTDMAVGKMTAALEICRGAKQRGIDARFVATGQTGITIAGKGVPLDAVRLDYACGAVEQAVLAEGDGEWIVVEGQGAINHPGSTATLPLMRGTCPTHLVLCCRAGQTHLLKIPEIPIPRLTALIELYEAIGQAGGTFTRPKTSGVMVNTAHLDENQAKVALSEISRETGLPASDPLRFGLEPILDAVA
jgi:uncharacterized NAD-dependent epimerase/dehydratase family protein